MELSHYTKLETAYEIIRKNSFKIFYGSFLRANDAKETMYWHFRTADNKQTSELKLLQERETSKQIKNKLATASFTIDKDDIPGYYRPRMWDQYGEQNKGVCIVFNKDKILNIIKKKLDNNKKLYYREIEYLNLNPPKYYEGELKNIYVSDIKNTEELERKIFDSEESIYAYLFRKHIDWSNEAEYRILIRNINNQINSDKPYIDIPCIKAIEKIILGSYFYIKTDGNPELNDEDLRQRMNFLRACKNKHLRCQRIRWTNGVPANDMMFDHFWESYKR